MKTSILTIGITMVLFSFLSTTVQADSDELDIKFAGALEFSDKDTLFVGDNYNGSIYAFDMPANTTPSQVNPIKIDNIDVRVANLIGVGPRALEINDMAVHPVSKEIFISVTRIGNLISKPAIVKVGQDSGIEVLDLASFSFTKQPLSNYPNQETTFKVRGLMGQPPTAKDIAKGDVKLSSLAIMDMTFHNNELFVSGVAYEDFLSTLRRIPFPFNGKQTVAKVQIYHSSHDQYETRAPIRAMSIQEIDGKDQLIAAYTCSPIALIPLDKIVDGAKIAAGSVGNIGNGQPIDMIPYTWNKQTMLFVSNNSRSPQVIPVTSFNGAKIVTHKDFPRGGKMDLMPGIPFGPIGTAVMFEGVPLHADLLGEKFLVSLTRDVVTGGLNLDSNLSFFPNRLNNLQAEYDFPQYDPDKAKELAPGEYR